MSARLYLSFPSDKYDIASLQGAIPARGPRPLWNSSVDDNDHSTLYLSSTRFEAICQLASYIDEQHPVAVWTPHHSALIEAQLKSTQTLEKPWEKEARIKDIVDSLSSE